jgi:hypothetical protein
VKSIAIVLLSCLLLTACSSRYATNGESIYMQSQNGQNLLIPSPLSSDTISHFYDLPQPTENPTVSLEPPASILSAT